jgi:hypothetical protein
MTTLTIDELQDKPRLKALLDAGDIIELRENNELIARILPQPKAYSEVSSPSPSAWPDFEARRKKIFGDRALNAVDDFLEHRHGRY